MKISVVGMGRVGAATAFSLVVRGLPHELVLVGRTKEKALGDAHDLLHASALVRPMRIVAGEAADTAGSDIVILAASVAAHELRRPPGAGRAQRPPAARAGPAPGRRLAGGRLRCPDQPG